MRTMSRTESVFNGKFILGLLLLVIVAGCQRNNQKMESRNKKESSEDKKMATVVELERLLTEGDRGSVELAQQLGEAAWPAIKRAEKMQDYRSRQIAMICAGRIGGDEAGHVLAAGLSDQNINVRLAAAKQLSVDPPATAQHVVLNTLTSSRQTETVIRELLVLTAGYFAGEQTEQVLRPIYQGNDPYAEPEDQASLADHAMMALAKLGDSEATQTLINKLTSADPHERYEGLGQLRYVNDSKLASHAKLLLTDRAVAQAVGPNIRPRYRRVCDQAVDTLVHLLKLSPPFEAKLAKIYSDTELMQINQLVP